MGNCTNFLHTFLFDFFIGKIKIFAYSKSSLMFFYFYPKTDSETSDSIYKHWGPDFLTQNLLKFIDFAELVGPNFVDKSTNDNVKSKV